MDGWTARWRYEREKEQLVHRQHVMGLGFIYKHMLRQDCQRPDTASGRLIWSVHASSGVVLIYQCIG